MKHRALLAALGLVPLLQAAAPAAWERLAPLPVGNGGCIAAAIADGLVVAGGTTWQGDTKLWLDQIWTYDARRDAWRETGRLPAPVGYPVTGHDGGPVWFAGGSSGPATHRALWQLTPTGARLAARLEQGFVIASGALLGSTLYAVGGTDDQARTDRTTNACFAIDVRTGALARLADYPEAGLITGTAAAAAGRLFVFGGGRWDPEGKKVVNHATAHAYAPAEKRWAALPPLPHPGRGYSAVALDDRHILLAGGYRNDQVGFVADAYLFDVIARTYAPTTPLPYAAMVHLVRSGDWLYCLGGEDRMKHRTDAVYRIEWAHLLAASRR